MSRVIPAGTKVTYRVWVRTNLTGVSLEITNDANTYNISPPFPFTITTPDTWQLLERTITLSKDWRGTESLRAPLTPGTGQGGKYIDFSDATIDRID